jgi:hypothetical protein
MGFATQHPNIFVRPKRHTFGLPSDKDVPYAGPLRLTLRAGGPTLVASTAPTAETEGLGTSRVTVGSCRVGSITKEVGEG